MDGYRDLAPFSAGYYTSSRYQPYAVDARSSYSAADPLAAFARFPVDAGYCSSLPELLPLSRYPARERLYSPRQRFSTGRRPSAQAATPKRRPPPQNLGPKKTPFKKTLKNSQPNNSTPKKGPQSNASQRKLPEKEQISGKSARNPHNSVVASLAKETQELHSLFRTGVDTSTGKKLVTPAPKKSNATPAKRKADVQQEGDAAFSAKKSRAKNKKVRKKLAKEKKQDIKKDEKPVVLTPKAVKVEPPVLTEEEKQEVETSLALQDAACKAVGEFLGIPEKIEEPAKSEAPNGDAAEAKPAEEQPIEGQAKPDEAAKATPMTPEEEKELEEKGYKFFSKLLEENQGLRNLYLEKKDAGTFECLVCHSIDPETSKKFTNLTSLIMHTSMRKQKRPEHRGYGHAVCDVLGWESPRALKLPAKQVKEEAELPKQPLEEKVPEEGNP